MGHSFTAATIYLSLLSYLLAVVCWVTERRGTSYRWLWTVGCIFLWAHAVCGFHFYHGWSHSAAVEETARQTEAVLGWRFGVGIWFSYGLLVVWSIDVLMAWTVRGWTEQARNYWGAAVHIYAFFILFNGTVVFEQGVIRWAGIIGTIWVARLAWRFRKRPALQVDHVKIVND